MAKATKWTLCTRRLARHATGISPCQMRQLYQAVAIPSFSYAADIWFMPIEWPVGCKMARGSVGVARRLTSVQRIATMAITGALCTSATDILEVHANLWPIELLMHWTCHRVVLWLAVLPDTHPLHKIVKVTACQDVKRHRSPLHLLLHTFRIKPADYELIAPGSRPPNRRDSLLTHIAGSREESWEEDLHDDAKVCIYSDGSGLNGMAAAAAVLFWGGREIEATCYRLGPLSHHTTYEAEIVGVLLALQLVSNEDEADTVSIRLDNQAVVWALTNHRAQPAQSLLDAIHGLCDDWRKCNQWRRSQIRISWVSGHDRAMGNERADAEAKKAVEEGSSPDVTLPVETREDELPVSLAAAVAAFRDELHVQWRELWARSPQWRKLAKIDAKLPSPAFLWATDDLTRAQVSVLMQLRTGHAPLNTFLHQIGKVDSPCCPACLGADETVHHFLFDCPAHAHAQHALARKLGRLSKSVHHLLGNWRAFQTTLKFVGETGRLQTSHGDLPMKPARDQ